MFSYVSDLFDNLFSALSQVFGLHNSGSGSSQTHSNTHISSTCIYITPALEGLLQIERNNVSS